MLLTIESGISLRVNFANNISISMPSKFILMTGTKASSTAYNIINIISICYHATSILYTLYFSDFKNVHSCEIIIIIYNYLLSDNYIFLNYVLLNL